MGSPWMNDTGEVYLAHVFPAITQILQDVSIVKCFIVASASIFVYDTILTLPSEVRFIWRSKWRPGKVLYFATRYPVFVDLTMSIVYWMCRSRISNKTCNRMISAESWLFLLGTYIAGGILSLRTYALWERSPRVLVFLVVLTHLLDNYVSLCTSETGCLEGQKETKLLRANVSQSVGGGAGTAFNSSRSSSPAHELSGTSRPGYHFPPPSSFTKISRTAGHEPSAVVMSTPGVVYPANNRPATLAQHGEISPAPTVLPCDAMLRRTKLYLNFAVVVAFEFVVLAMTLWKGFEQWRQCQSPVMSTLYRDSIMIFVCLFAVSTTNLMLFMLANLNAFYDLLARSQRVIHSVLSARVVLHLRIAAAYERTGKLSTIAFIEPSDVDPLEDIHHLDLLDDDEEDDNELRSTSSRNSSIYSEETASDESSLA